MGLDVMAFRNLKESTDVDEGIDFHDNQYFPGRAEGIDCTKCYEYAKEDAMDVLSTGYGTYNNWRDWLAKEAGYSSAPAAWAATGGPFWELINFADNEGTIGPVVSRKLSLDFTTYADKVKGDSLNMARYNAFATAFAFASVNGCVKFM